MSGARCPACGKPQPDEDVSFACRSCGADLAAKAEQIPQPPGKSPARAVGIGLGLAAAIGGGLLFARACTEEAIRPPSYDTANRYLAGEAIPPPAPVNALPPVTLGELSRPGVAPAAWPPEGAGVISGRVIWQRVRKPPIFPFLSEDRNCGLTLLIPAVPVAELGGVTEAAVVILPEGPVPAAPPEPEPLVATLRACLPEPRLLAGAPGTRVVFQTVGLARHDLVPGAPLPGLPATIEPRKPAETVVPERGMVTVTDPAHPWERFTLVALPTVLSARVNSEGFFRIAGVPPGPVTVRFFTEATGIFERKLVLAPGGEVMLAVDLSDELRTEAPAPR